MYVDLGKRRGRLRFNLREVVLLWGMVASGLGYVVRTEVALARVREQLGACQREIQGLRQATAGHGGGVAGEPSAVNNRQTTEADQ